MEPFVPKDISYPTQKPSFDSWVNYKRRQAQLAQEAEHPSDIANDNEQRPLQPEPTYTETEQKLMDEARQLSLVGHLTELRSRLIIMAIAIVIGWGIAYYYVDFLLDLLIAPAGKLYYMKPTEAFFTYMKVSFVGGVILSSPILLYEVWMFVIPALTMREKKVTNWILPIALTLFALGILFSYYLVLPATVKFFIGFGTDELQPLFSIGQYVDFVIAFILPFGFIFELPLILTIMGYFNLITSAFLRSKRKIFILLSFIIGGLISPTPDMFSQTMIALPMIILYESSLFILAKVMKR